MRLAVGIVLVPLVCAEVAPCATGTRGMVASEHRLASEAGVEILRAGGNAIDAAIATALAVCVLNPSSCGMGGGGFMLIYDRKKNEVAALDYRETAPAAASRDMFVRDGKADSAARLSSGLAVAVPGEVAGLAEALNRYGTMSLSDLAAPAVRYARDGFTVEAHLASMLEKVGEPLRSNAWFRKNFFRADGTPLREGDRLVQPELAKTLETIGREGARAFYEGPIADAIVAATAAAGGVFTDADLVSYRPVWRRPLHAKFRGLDIYTMPPPSSGGGVLIQILNILSRDDLVALGAHSPTSLHLLTEAMKFGFADRAAHYGDPDFVYVPLVRLLAPGYGRVLRSRIHAARTFPPEYYGTSAAAEDRGTSHLSVVDLHGNAVACTTTINTGFGSGIIAGDTGIVLNNEMDDFSAQPGVANVYGLVGSEANAIAPRKRPLSSMTPVIALREGEVTAVAGGSGGPFIISATLQVLINTLVYGYDAQAAVDAPRIHHQWMPPVLLVERGVSPAVRNVLARIGHAVKEVPGIGAVQLVRRADGGWWEGASDPRKGGQAAGW